MPKGKSHKGTLKRLKITGTNKLVHKRSGTSHLMSGTPGKQSRKLRRPLVVSASVAKKMEKVLHTHLRGRES